MASLSAAEIYELERRYLQALAGECGDLPSEREDEGPVSLINIMIMPQALASQRESPIARRSDLPPDRPPKNHERSKDERRKDSQAPPDKTLEREPPQLPVTLSQALQEQRHLALLGEPGAGKSTALRFVALCFADRDLAIEHLGWNEKLIPVMLSLQESAELIAKEGFQDSLAKSVERLLLIEHTKAIQLFEEWKKSSRLIVLLDGLDEVPEQLRTERIIPNARNLAHALDIDHCRTVVTSRLAGYMDLGKPFSEYTLCSLSDPGEIRNYAAGWITALKGVSRDEAEQEAVRLLEQVESQPGLGNITGNPLLLRLLVSTYLDNGQIARTRSELYERYVEDAWKRAQKRETPLFSYEVALHALETVAWHLHISEQLAKDERADGQDTIGELQNAIRKQAPEVEDTRGLLQFLRKAMGIIRFSNDGPHRSIGFIHQTFREYFVARRLAHYWRTDSEKTWHFLKPRLHHPAWKQPLLLLSVMLQSDGSQLVKLVLGAKSDHEDELHRDLLLAGECLATGAKVNNGQRHLILNGLLLLYIRRLMDARSIFEQATHEQLMAKPIEEIFASLGDTGRSEIVVSLLAFAGGTKATANLDLRLVMMTLAFAIVYRGPDFVRLGMYYRLGTLDTLKLMIQSMLFWPLIPFVLIKNEFDIRTEMRHAVAKAAIRAIGNLRIGTPEAISILLTALSNKATRGVAAETLGKVGPGTDEVIQRMMDAQLEHRKHDWETVNKIIEALGTIVQRSEEAFPRLLRFVEQSESDRSDLPYPTSFNYRYPAAMAICKAAEVNVDALAFVLQNWQRLNSDSIDERPDEGVREGLIDGWKFTSLASAEVVGYLLSAMQHSHDWKEIHGLDFFLFNILGDEHLVKCKLISRDGSIRYQLLDLTDELFNIILLAGPSIGPNPLSHVVKWGFKKPELIVRLINNIRDADPWLL